MINKNKFTNAYYGWKLTDSGKFFLGKQVFISVDTKIDSKHQDKEIFEEQIETLNIIYATWEELSAIIEQEILNYEKIPKAELLKVIDSPKICLDMDDNSNKPLANNRWSFVLSVTENEDFEWHVEFEGKTHVDTWAGD